MVHQIAKNLTWLTLGNFLVKPIWFVFITYVCIRFIGLREYGLMTATLALMGIVNGVLTLGTSSYSIREVARDPSKSTLFFSNFLPYRLSASMLAIAIGLAIELILGNQAILIMALFAGTYILFMNVTEYCRTLFRSHERFEYEAISTVVEKLLVVTCGSLALVYDRTATGVLLGMTIGILLTFLLNFRWVIKDFARMSVSLIDRSFFKRAMPQAIPLGLASVFVLLFFRIDSVMIEAMKGELPTGQYAIAFRITEALFIVPAMVTTILLPRLSHLFVSGFSRFKTLSQKGIIGLFGVSFLLALLVFAFAPLIVQSMDPTVDAEPAIALLRILVWAVPVASVNSLMSTIMTASDLQKKLAWVLGFAAFLNIGLNFVLIPSLSATGASYATIATEVFVAVSFITLLPRKGHSESAS
ncbi:MAG: flippase [Bacteroidetes bacterium]|nr:flippase [Bacteroidota bacterium]